VVAERVEKEICLCRNLNLALGRSFALSCPKKLCNINALLTCILTVFLIVASGGSVLLLQEML
jgi:hypothetical protein